MLSKCQKQYITLISLLTLFVWRSLQVFSCNLYLGTFEGRSVVTAFRSEGCACFVPAFHGLLHR